jgi:hypothetical protein
LIRKEEEETLASFGQIVAEMRNIKYRNYQLGPVHLDYYSGE